MWFFIKRQERDIVVFYKMIKEERVGEAFSVVCVKNYGHG